MNTGSQSRYAVPSKVPHVLYQYRSINDHLRDMLIQKHIWVANPLSFNDPFDCAIPISTSSTPEEAILCTTELLKGMDVSTQFRTEALKAAHLGRLHDPERLQQALQTTMSQTGVACFSKVPKDILMWSHYASQHEGVCIGFDPSVFWLCQAQRVNYEEELPFLKMSELLLSEQALIRHLITKSKHWAYEQEWRFFRADTKFQSNHDSRRATPFPPEAVRSVIFGCRVSPKRRSEILMLLRDWPTPIHDFQAEKHSSKFALRMRRLPADKK